jgi:hypothetical protein
VGCHTVFGATCNTAVLELEHLEDAMEIPEYSQFFLDGCAHHSSLSAKRMFRLMSDKLRLRTNIALNSEHMKVDCFAAPEHVWTY